MQPTHAAALGRAVLPSEHDWAVGGFASRQGKAIAHYNNRAGSLIVSGGQLQVIPVANTVVEIGLVVYRPYKCTQLLNIVIISHNSSGTPSE